MRRYTFRRLVLAGLLTTLIASLANILYFIYTRSIGERYLLPLDPNGAQLAPMPILMPVLGCIFVGILGTLFFGLLIRYNRKPVTVFLSVAVTALILSFGGSFGVPGASIRTKLFLSAMNLLTAVIVVGGILLFGKEKLSYPPKQQ